MDVTATLLEVSVALGILYATLPAARYRDKLYDEIAKCLGKFAERGIDGASYHSLVRDDGVFGEHHRYVSMWVGELPADRFGDAKRALAPHMGKRNSGTLPWAYRWFKCNGDRWVVVILSTALSAAALWSVAVGFLPASLVSPVCLVAAGIGHGVFVFHMWLGRRRVVRRNAVQLVAAVQYMTTSLEPQVGAKAEKVVREIGLDGVPE